MSLELLELVEGGEGRIFIVQMDDESDRHQSIIVVIKKRSSAAAARQRPPKRVLNNPRAEFLRGNLPQLLEANSIFLWAVRRLEFVAGDRLFRQGSARAFRKQYVLAPQFHAPGETGLWFAVPSNSHIAGRDADYIAFLPEKQFGRSEARVDFNAEAFRARAEPPRDRAEGANKVAVVAH